MQNKRIPLSQIKDGSSILPVHAKLFDFFSPRSRKIQVVSFGVNSFGLETFITENTGCNIDIYDNREASNKTFELVQQLANKTYTFTESSPEWLKELSNRWIRSEKLVFHKTLPLGQDGTIQTNDGTIQTTTFPFSKIDILSVNYPEYECKYIYSILHSGFRPGIIHITWNKHPDEDTSSMLCAGHLQMCGYTLVAFIENSFMYMYNDQCVYETTSWACTDSPNPALESYRRQLFETYMNTSAQQSTTNT